MNKPDEKAPRFEKRKWTSAGHAMAALAMAALLGGCGGGSRDGGFRMPPMDGGGTPTAPAFTGFQMKTLSSPAHLISGGDTLLELTIPEGIALDGVKLQLNGREAPAPLSVHDAGARTLRGLLSGLTTDRASPAGSANTLRVLNAANPSQYSEFSLVNYPITGPMLSGPHIQPYECRTVENELGKPLDADCSAATQLKWFYRTQDKKFKPLPELGGGYPEDMVRTTTNDGVTVPYIVRVESGTINRGVYRLAMLDDPTQASSPWKPGKGWNHKLVARFGCCGSAQYNQGVYGIDRVLSDVDLSRGFAYLISTELWNNQHANPHLQGETLMMLKEHIIKHFGPLKWTVGKGGSGGSLQQHLIAQLYPGLLDGLQPDNSYPETFMPEIMECRLLNRVYDADTGTWTVTKQNAVNGFNTGTCRSWDRAFADIIRANNARGCGVTEPANVANIFDRQTNPKGLRCDLFQTNIHLFGKRPGTEEARRPLDNVGIQYGLGALNRGAISVQEFLDLNERVGGYDGDGIPQAERTRAEPEALTMAYAGGFKNSFSGPGLANVPIITQRYNGDSVGDIHDTMQDLIIRARLQRANGRSDNQIIWTLGSNTGVDAELLTTSETDYVGASLDLMNKWLDSMAADAAPPSTEKVVRNKPAGANDACWDLNGVRIDEPASTDPAARCNKVYPRFSTPRLEAGSPMVNDVLKCQLKPVDIASYAVAFTEEQQDRLKKVFPEGVCDWSKPSVNQVPLRGTYLRLPLS